MDGFLLSRADRTLRTTGIRRLYDTVASASRALHRDEADLVVGALPFDPERPPALMQPEEIVVTDGPWHPPAGLGALPPVRMLAQNPQPRVHVARVRALIDRIELGEFGKVVAARSVSLDSDEPLEPLAVAARLVDRYPTAATYAVDLSAAGERYWGHTLVGATPEVLVSRRGSTVTC
ncbi:MAG: chorismate-binding protein, partial [Rhodococcus sp. (in: high G+C Gram-positive bacteria)]|uniref:chorismate-binding protein n=1 Tax=Rhodococcus sp. TaxID=1831 RepID=UPI003BB525C7